MTKYYKVLKDNFLWLKGAILQKQENVDGYRPIDGTNIWDTTGLNDKEYISARIIENCPDYFVEVYPVNLLTRVVYKIKEEARALMEKEYGDAS